MMTHDIYKYIYFMYVFVWDRRDATSKETRSFYKKQANCVYLLKQ